KIYEKNFAKYFASFFSVISLCLVILKFSIDLFPAYFFKTKDFKHYEDAYLELGGKYVGKYILQKLIKKKETNIVIIDYPKYFAASKYTKYLIKGFEEAFYKAKKDKIQIKIEETIPKDNSIFWLSAEEFDRIVLAHPEADIFISLVGLPYDIENIKCQDNLKNMPYFIFFGGNLEYLKTAIEYDLVAAAIVRLPGSSLAGNKPPSEDKEEIEFFERFILIDRDNMRYAEYVFPVLFK
ncbi:MAG TPA: hypothetical protein P5105_07175, partial [Victivallales bacterium]|nr:hypothetical protein [Victivallales bacterium]